MWSVPLIAAVAVIGALAAFMTLTPNNTAEAQAEEVPGTPMNLKVVAVSPTSLELSWDPPADGSGGTPDGYRIDYSNDGDVWYALEPNYSSTVYTDDDGLKAKQMRYYRVLAFNSSGHGGVLGPVGAETEQSTKPDAVDDLALDTPAPTEEVITLSWTAPENPEGAPVTEYRIQSSKNGRSYSDLKVEKASVLCDGDDCTYEDKDLLESSKRWYRVYASNSVGESDASNSPSATTAAGRIPTVPQNLRAGLNPSGRMWLYWDEPADATTPTDPDDPPGAPILGYYIQGGPVATTATSGAVAAGTFQKPNAAGTALEAVDGVSPSKNVLFYVEASTDLALTSSVLSRLDDFAGAPGTFDLNDPPTPNDAADDTSTHWAFRVMAVNRVVQRHAEDGIIGTGITDDSSGTDEDGNWSSFIRVNQLAEDTPDDPDTQTTLDDNLLSRPTLKAKRDTNVNGGRTTINLEWRTARSVAGTSYRVEVSEDRIDWDQITDADGTTVATIADGAGKREFTHAGLTAGTTYYYRVFAQHTNTGVGDPAGDIWTEASLTVSETTAQADKPDPPTLNSVEAESETEIEISWTRPGANGTKEVGYGKVIGYHLEHSDDGHTWMVLKDNTGLKKICGSAGTDATCSYTHEDLVQGQTKYYRVSTINNATRSSLRMSDPSDALSATTQRSLASDDPGGLVAKPYGATAIKLIWNARADDITAAPIIGYKIESSPLNASGDCAENWSVLVADTMSTTTSYTHMGLSPETGMCYRIFGINVVATSSGFVGFGDDYITTYDNDAIASSTDAMVPGMPTAVSATADSDSQITVNWTAPANPEGAPVTHYIIERRYTGDMAGDITAAGYNADVDGASFAFSNHMEWWETLNCTGMLQAAGSDEDPEGSGPDKMMYCAHYADTMPTDGMTFPADKIIAVGSATDMAIEALFDARYVITDDAMTTYVDMDLMAETEYTYRVSAVNAKGRSMWSAADSATTMATDTTLGAPTGVTATVDGNSVTIMWTDGANADRYIAVLFDSNWEFDTDHVAGHQTDGMVTFSNVPAGAYTAVVISIQDDDSGNAEAINFGADTATVN
jgi:hypothetical protein